MLRGTEPPNASTASHENQAQTVLEPESLPHRYRYSTYSQKGKGSKRVPRRFRGVDGRSSMAVCVLQVCERSGF